MYHAMGVYNALLDARKVINIIIC